MAPSYSTLISEHCFIPTVSALALTNPNRDLAENQNSDPLENPVTERVNGILKSGILESLAGTIPGRNAATPRTDRVSLQLQTPPSELQLPKPQRSTPQLGTVGAALEKPL